MTRALVTAEVKSLAVTYMYINANNIIFIVLVKVCTLHLVSKSSHLLAVCNFVRP